MGKILICVELFPITRNPLKGLLLIFGEILTDLQASGFRRKTLTVLCPGKCHIDGVRGVSGSINKPLLDSRVLIYSIICPYATMSCSILKRFKEMMPH